MLNYLDNTSVTCSLSFFQRGFVVHIYIEKNNSKYKSPRKRSQQHMVSNSILETPDYKYTSVTKSGTRHVQ